MAPNNPSQDNPNHDLNNNEATTSTKNDQELKQLLTQTLQMFQGLMYLMTQNQTNAPNPNVVHQPQ